ncbi:MAG TPA: NAD-dependent epimerase/dehydratase family protein [Pseudonocardia sp.]|jgi:nucleoside-diphosphate-sugar epimerase|nr:NAD-dependent epimerase/dehydratase family protein [Pseudonocardia sp.]
MRILVLGGTVFLSHAVAAEALRRGHDVSCLARGTSGAVPKGARLLVADRNSPGAVAGAVGSAVGREKFDAVVDVATMSLPWVRDALAALADSVAHWTFVSSINVYADKATPGQGTDAPLLAPYVEPTGADATPAVDPDLYGAAKVASENAVREALGAHAFVLRAGLLVGPGDPHDRFGYWPARLARGGRTLVPDALDQPLQYLDARDLAGWIVTAAERELGGVFDAVGPLDTLGGVLAGIASAVGAADLELVPVPPSELLSADVTPWAGPRSLPLWLPASHHGFLSRDTAPARDAGLVPRSLASTSVDVLAYERSRGLDRERRAGLSARDEGELLTRFS